MPDAYQLDDLRAIAVNTAWALLERNGYDPAHVSSLQALTALENHTHDNPDSKAAQWFAACVYYDNYNAGQIELFHRAWGARCQQALATEHYRAEPTPRRARRLAWPGGPPYNESAALAPIDPAILPAALDPAILAGQLAPSSIAGYRADLGHYATWCQGQGFDPLDAASLARYRAALAGAGGALSAATINRRLAAVKRLVKEAAGQGRLDANTAARFAGVEGVKPSALRDRQRRHNRTRIPPDEMRRLCAAPDQKTLIGQRDAALLALLASSGVRISEAVGLQVGNIYPRAGGYFVSVLGKGQAEPREAPLSREAYALVMRWIQARPVMSVFVFTSWGGRGADRATPAPMTPAAAWQVVQHYAAACGLEHIKPHDFRRFVGTQLAARDIRQAQKALGHKRIDTTAAHYVLDELAPGLTDDLY